MKKNVKLIDLSQLIESYGDNPYQQLGENARTAISTFSKFDVDGFYECALYMGDHCATHMDASLHFNPKGTPVDKVPLEAMYGPACILDFSYKTKHQDITVDDIKKAAEKADVTISDFKIVCIRTDQYKLWGTPAYHENLLNLTVEATEYLINEGMVLLCVDMVTTELDRLIYGMDTTLAKGASERYPGHCLMKKYEWYMIENMANFDKIPGSTFTLSAFPLKIKNGSGAPMRAVAIVED